jgi:hypothetical protein
MLDIDVSNNNELVHVWQTKVSRLTAAQLPTKSTHSCRMLAARSKAVTCERPHCHFKTDHLMTTSALDIHYLALTSEVFASI